MSKLPTKRMDWYKTYPRDFQSSMPYRLMTPAQRGAYRDLLDCCWINYPNVSFPHDEAHIREVCNIRSNEQWREIMPKVLEKFDLRDGRLYNSKLLQQVDEAMVDEANAKIRRMGKSDIPEPTTVLTTVPTGVKQESDSCVTNRREKRREETEEEEEKETDSSMSFLDHLSIPQRQGYDHNGRKKGEPGYFERLQYPGTSPKAVFGWMTKVWARLQGNAGEYLRYPSKYPEQWEQMCDSISADILVPAFELWIVKHALKSKVEWPLVEFIRNAKEYTTQVAPQRDEVRQQIIKKQTEQATAQNQQTEAMADAAWEKAHPGWKIQRDEHGQKIGAVQSNNSTEPGPEALFGPEEPK